MTTTELTVAVATGMFIFQAENGSEDQKSSYHDARIIDREGAIKKVHMVCR